MTYADEEFLPEGQVESPNYPTAFGITFTPRVGGIVFAVLGLLGATYLFLNVVQPEWERYQTLQGEVENIKGEIQNLEAIQKTIDEKKAQLQEAKQQQKQVLSLFATEKTLDTLLLDLNSFVKARNGRLTVYNPGTDPQQAQTVIINDGSLGPQVNGKLKRKTTNIELEGSFDQIQSILRSFERLQTLLLVKDFQVELSDELVVLVDPESGKSVLGVRKQGDQKVLPGAKPNLKARFKLDAILPIEEEASADSAGAAKLAPQPTPPAPQPTR